MKVLHVLPSVSPYKGGPSQAVFGMAKALKKHGIEVEIATTNDNGTNYLDVPLNKKIDYQGVPVIFFSRCSLPMKEFIFSYDISKWLLQQVRNYDLIHTHYLFSYASSYAGAMARYHKVPYIVRTIGQLTPWALEQSRLKKQLYCTLIERRNLNKASAIHCTSLGEAENVHDFGIKTPTFNIPLGVESSSLQTDCHNKLRYKYNIPSNIPIILFLSRIHPKKRLDLLLKAIVKLKQDNKQFHLIIAGSGEQSYVSQMQALVETDNIKKYVTFTGFVKGVDKDILLQGSDIFVLPSYSENFGISVAEAIAASLPVVITQGIQISSAIAEAEAGIIIEDNVESLVIALNKLISSSSLRHKLGQNGRNLANSEYSWSSIGSKLAELYARTIEVSKLAGRS